MKWSGLVDRGVALKSMENSCEEDEAKGGSVGEQLRTQQGQKARQRVPHAVRHGQHVTATQNLKQSLGSGTTCPHPDEARGK